MKQYLLFAGQANVNAAGVHGLVGDFESFADAFVSLVDRRITFDWWHILDTQTGEVVERQHLKVHNGLIGFERSHWVLGQAATEQPITLPTPAPETSGPKLPALESIEADLRSVLKSGLKDINAKGSSNEKANGSAKDVAAGS